MMIIAFVSATELPDGFEIRSSGILDHLKPAQVATYSRDNLIAMLKLPSALTLNLPRDSRERLGLSLRVIARVLLRMIRMKVVCWRMKVMMNHQKSWSFSACHRQGFAEDDSDESGVLENESDDEPSKVLVFLCVSSPGFC